MAIPFAYLNRFNGETGSLTATKLNTGAVSTEAWSIVQAEGYANENGTFVDHDVSGLDLPQIQVGETTCDLDGAGGIRFALTEANHPGMDVWRIQFPQSPSPSFQQMQAFFHARWDITDESGAIGDYNNDLALFSGPGFTSAQFRDQAAAGTAKGAVSHGGGGNGKQVPFTQGQDLFVLVKHDGLNLQGEVVFLDATDRTLLGASASIPALSSGDIGNFDFGTYLRMSGLARSGTIDLKFVALDPDISAWPPEDLVPTVPAPTDLSRTQSAVNTVSVDWDRGLCNLWRVERRIDGGSWTTLEERYRANEAFVDDTLSDGDEVEYRITTLIGTRESASETTTPITVNNSAFGGPAFETIGSPGAIVEVEYTYGFQATALQDFDITHLGCHVTGDQFSPALPVSVYASDKTSLKGTVDVPTTGGAELMRYVECAERIPILEGETFYVVVGPLGYNKMGLWSTVSPSGAIGDVYDAYGSVGSFFVDTVENRINGPVGFLWETPQPDEVTGEGGATAPAGIAAGFGAPLITGTGGAQAPAGEAGGSGTPSVVGAGDVEAPAGEASGSGTPHITGTGAAQAPVGIASGSGTPIIAGTGSVQAPSTDVDGSGAPVVTGTGGATAPAGEASGSDGLGEVTGEGAATAPAGIASGTGAPIVTGDGGVEGQPGEAAGVGTVVVVGEGDAEAAPGVGAGAGTPTVTGTGAATAPASVASGSETTAPVYGALTTRAVRARVLRVTARSHFSR